MRVRSLFPVSHLNGFLESLTLPFVKQIFSDIQGVLLSADEMSALKLRCAREHAEFICTHLKCLQYLSEKRHFRASLLHRWDIMRSILVAVWSIWKLGGGCGTRKIATKVLRKLARKMTACYSSSFNLTEKRATVVALLTQWAIACANGLLVRQTLRLMLVDEQTPRWPVPHLSSAPRGVGA